MRQRAFGASASSAIRPDRSAAFRALAEQGLQRSPATLALVGRLGLAREQGVKQLGIELSRAVWRLDLAALVSKYIGETEKNLRSLFERAQATGAILFFDEGDALFGRRSEVRDAHDRYSDIEVNFLLQKLEDFRGLVVLGLFSEARLRHVPPRRHRVVLAHPPP